MPVVNGGVFAAGKTTESQQRRDDSWIFEIIGCGLAIVKG